MIAVNFDCEVENLIVGKIKNLIIFIVILFQGRIKDISSFSRRSNVCLIVAGKNEYMVCSTLVINVSTCLFKIDLTLLPHWRYHTV
jgi:hypothetical protein